MKTVYNTETGKAETVYAVDARERVARGGWSYEPVDVASEVGDAGTIKPITDMTIVQMRAYAKEKGITLGAEATTKDAVLAVIQAAEAKE